MLPERRISDTKGPGTSIPTVRRILNPDPELSGRPAVAEIRLIIEKQHFIEKAFDLVKGREIQRTMEVVTPVQSQQERLTNSDFTSHKIQFVNIFIELRVLFFKKHDNFKVSWQPIWSEQRRPDREGPLSQSSFSDFRDHRSSARPDDKFRLKLSLIAGIQTHSCCSHRSKTGGTGLNSGKQDTNAATKFDPTPRFHNFSINYCCGEKNPIIISLLR